VKINTNLSATQLEAISKGVSKAARKMLKPYKASNPAEKELMDGMDSLFDELLSDISLDVKEILGEPNG